jgi:hypothetical protein
MQRRKFIKSSLGLSISAAALTTAGCWNPFESKQERLTRLLSYVYDPSFKALAETKNAVILKRFLKLHKVITEDHYFDFDLIKERALTDELVVYNDFYYTATEVDIYCLAYLSQQDKTA